MTVDETIVELRELSEMGYGNRPVMLAYQPSWPLRDRVGKVTMLNVDGDGEAPDDEPVYIVSGGQCNVDPYAPQALFTGG